MCIRDSAFLYAALLLVWPHESIVPAADLAAAALVAWLLILLGRRRYTAPVGYGAALLFLLLGDPYLQRLSGIYVRGQCEPFMALAITAALVALAGPRTRPWPIVGAGLALGAAFWLKYNSAAYAITLVAALWAWRAPDTARMISKPGFDRLAAPARRGRSDGSRFMPPVYRGPTKVQ